MRDKIFKGIALLSLLAAAGTGCEKKREVSGQIFVSTAGGESVRLGSVPVLLFPSEVMHGRLTNYAHTVEVLTAFQESQVEEVSKVSDAMDAITERSDVMESNKAHLAEQLKKLKSHGLELCDSVEKTMKQIQKAHERIFSPEGGRELA